MKKWLWLVSLGIIFTLAYTKENKCPVAKEILRNIPLEDQVILDTFLRKVIGQDQFGFALFGSKAAATSGYFTYTPWGSFLFHPYHLIQKEEFYTFKKYKHLFQSENFHWMEGPEKKSIRIIGFSFLNKKVFLKTVSKHLTLFQNMLGRKITPEGLYKELSASNEDLLEALQNNVTLEGILLGFGKESALTYLRWNQLKDCLKPNPPLRKTYIEPSPGFDTLEEEYNHLDYNFYCSVRYRDRWCILMMKPVRFMDLDVAEARRLRRKYRYDAEKINKLFEGKSYLEVVLEQIWAKDPICLE